MSKLPDSTTVGDMLQTWCIAVLEKVARAYPNAEVEENGQSAAKLIINSGDISSHYIYLGLGIDGTALVSLHKALASGKPQTILGPIKLPKVLNTSVATFASKILNKIEL